MQAPNNYCIDAEFSAIIGYLRTLEEQPESITQSQFFHFKPSTTNESIHQIFADVGALAVCSAKLTKLYKSNMINKQDFDHITSEMLVMSFAQITLYKVFPCPAATRCPCTPSYHTTANRFLDSSLVCPFYHHDRDRRRVPYINLSAMVNSDDVQSPLCYLVESAFSYRPHYSPCRGNPDDAYFYDRSETEMQVQVRSESDCDLTESFSQNYFESMYHPMFYKMFECQRNCKKHKIYVDNRRKYRVVYFGYCPFYHSIAEKHAWDRKLFRTLGIKREDLFKRSRNLRKQFR